MNIYEEIDSLISTGKIKDGEDLQKFKIRLARKHGMFIYGDKISQKTFTYFYY